MKKQLLSLSLGTALVFGAAHAVWAQSDNAAPPPPDTQTQGPGGAPRGADPERQLQHLTKRLGLTSEQQSQIRPALVEQQQQMQALWQDSSLSRQERRARMRTIRTDTQTKIEAVLNDQQKQSYEAMLAKMRHHRRMGGNPPPDAPPQPQ